jgi:uncharacterized membrane protein (DUF106 family)
VSENTATVIIVCVIVAVIFLLTLVDAITSHRERMAKIQRSAEKGDREEE